MYVNNLKINMDMNTDMDMDINTEMDMDMNMTINRIKAKLYHRLRIDNLDV
jgi:hypothetical protein